MREVTLTCHVYRYDELNDAAKEKVKRDYIETGIEDTLLYEDIMEELSVMFPQSSIKPQFNFGCCQGDGVNIYGEMSFDDLAKAENFAENFTYDEWKTLMAYKYCINIRLPENKRYTYCTAFLIDFAQEAIDNLESEGIRNINAALLYRFEQCVKEFVEDLCNEWKKDGYERLYNISDEYMSEFCVANDWEFNENGALWTLD